MANITRASLICFIFYSVHIQYSNYLFLLNIYILIKLKQDKCNIYELVPIHTDSSASIITPATLYLDIESAASNYVESDNDDDVTDDDLLVISPEDSKYISIFQNDDENFYEEIMSVEGVVELNNWNIQQLRAHTKDNPIVKFSTRICTMNV